jgi:ABC-type glycerol-3-phosphate transport system substrate-binding protein
LRRTCIILSVLLVVLVCGATATTAAEPVVITHLVYTHSGVNFQEWMMDLAQRYEKQNPGIVIDIIIGDQAKFDTMRLAGMPPDIIDIPDYAHLGPLGELVDIMPYLQRDNLVRLLHPAVLKSLTTPSGAVYSVPWQLAINTMYFNRDMFNQAGVTTPDIMGSKWDWDTLYQTAKKLTRDVNGDGIPETFGVDRPVGAMWRVLTFQAGGSYYEWDDLLQPVKSLWSSEPVIKAMEYNARFFREGLTATLNAQISDQTAYYFWNGKTAIDMNDGIALVGAYLKEATFDWDFSLMPRGDAGPVTMFNGSGPHIVSATKHFEECWQWIKFLAFNRDTVNEYMKVMGIMPALSAAMPSYPTVAGVANKNYQALFEQTNYPQPYTQWPVAAALNPRMVNMNPIWQGTTSARTHLEALNTQMQNIIDQQRAAK